MLIYNPGNPIPISKLANDLERLEKEVLINKLTMLRNEEPYIVDSDNHIEYNYVIVSHYLRLDENLMAVYNDVAIQQLQSLDYFLCEVGDFEKALDFIPNNFYIHL